VSDGTLADCAALKASGWGSALNWIIPSTPSDWCCSATGITCGGDDRRVTEIRFAGKQLTGMCPQVCKRLCKTTVCMYMFIGCVAIVLWLANTTCGSINEYDALLGSDALNCMCELVLLTGSLAPLGTLTGLLSVDMSQNNIDGMSARVCML
jgi:hypothetical protein